jgi:hypothetical protein
MYSELQNNQLSGSIPERLKRLTQLIYLDLSQNQLTGRFPLWLNRLKSLILLNLGQNDFSGKIPLVIGKGQNHAGAQLPNIREFVRRLCTRNALYRYKDIYRSVMLNFMGYLLKNEADIKLSKDLLWVNPTSPLWNEANLEKIVDVYIKAQEKHFQKNQLFMNSLNSASLKTIAEGI